MIATEFEFRYRVLISLVVFWLAFQVYAIDHTNVVWAFAPWNAPHGALLARLVFGLGTLVLGLAALLRTWATAYLRTDVVQDPKLHTDTLVADGPYRHVRNPLYLGTFVFSVGVGLLASRLGFVILVGSSAMRYLRLIGREESALEAEQGEKYLEYCWRVPRLLPSLSPRLPASGLAPRWGQAVFGEIVMWGFFVTLLGFTITLRERVAWTLAGAALLAWLAQQIVHRRRRATTVQAG